MVQCSKCFEVWRVENLFGNGESSFSNTNDQGIVDYLSRFTQWLPYQHKVEAFVDGVGFVPLPMNITTINRLYNKQFSQAEEMKAKLEEAGATVEIK